MDESQVHRGQEWLAELLTLSGLPPKVSVAVAHFPTDTSCWLTIDDSSLTAEQIESLTGQNGSVLDSIQYLLNTTLNLGLPDDRQQAFTVELNGYRVRRQSELQRVAEKAVQQAQETEQEVEIVSLSAAERRQVHTFLKTFEDVETYSRGQEPDRRLVVRLIQK